MAQHATLLEIVTALGVAISPIPGLQVREIVPNSIAVGQIGVALIYPRVSLPGSSEPVVNYDSPYGGTNIWHLTIRVAVPKSHDIEAQKLLYKFLDSTGEYSIIARLKADRTLGGIAQKVLYSIATGYGELEIGPKAVYQIVDFLVDVQS